VSGTTGPKRAEKASVFLEHGADIVVIDLRSHTEVAGGRIISITVWPDHASIHLDTGYMVRVKSAKVEVVEKEG